MNLAILKGRLTKNIDLKYSQAADPKAFCNFCIAINGYNDHVDFINCSAFGKTAEFLSKYFIKGQEILLQGHIHVEFVDNQDGKTVYTKIMTDRVDFCGSKADNASSDLPDEEDDMPF